MIPITDQEFLELARNCFPTSSNPRLPPLTVCIRPAPSATTSPQLLRWIGGDLIEWSIVPDPLPGDEPFGSEVDLWILRSGHGEQGILRDEAPSVFRDTFGVERDGPFSSVLPLVDASPTRAATRADPAVQILLEGLADEVVSAWVEVDGESIVAADYGVHQDPALEIRGRQAALVWFLLGQLPLPYMTDSLTIRGDVRRLPSLASSVGIASRRISPTIRSAVRHYLLYREILEAVDWASWSHSLRRFSS